MKKEDDDVFLSLDIREYMYRLRAISKTSHATCIVHAARHHKEKSSYPPFLSTLLTRSFSITIERLSRKIVAVGLHMLKANLRVQLLE